MYKIVFNGEKVEEVETIEDAWKKGFAELIKRYPPIEIFDGDSEKPVAEITFQAVIHWMGPVPRLLTPAGPVQGIYTATKKIS